MTSELLPPANEVWGKVIFSQACVSHSVHEGEGSLYDVTFCLAAWSHVHSRGLCLWPHVPSRGVSVQRRVSVQGVSVWDRDPVQGGGRGLCSVGGLCPAGSLSGRHPTFGEEQVVRILLECFLVENTVPIRTTWKDYS